MNWEEFFLLYTYLALVKATFVAIQMPVCVGVMRRVITRRGEKYTKMTTVVAVVFSLFLCAVWPYLLFAERKRFFGLYTRYAVIRECLTGLGYPRYTLRLQH